MSTVLESIRNGLVSYVSRVVQGALEAVSEPDGKRSYSRIIGIAVTVWAMALSTYVTVHTKQFADIPTGWLLIAVIPYSVNKLIRRKQNAV